MTSAELLADAFDRVRQNVHGAIDGLDVEQLAARLDPEANSMAWLVWHLARVQDDHVSAASGLAQCWTASGWADRFELPFDVRAIGYGQSAEEVGAVRSGAELLLGYYDAVHQQTLAFVRTLTDADLDRVVDTNWDPPVTLGVRLVSVLNDCLQHAGQAAYVRGLIERRG